MVVAVNCCTDRPYDAYGRRVKSKRPVGGQIRTVRHYLLPEGRPHLDKPSALMQPAPVPWSYAYLGDRLLARFDNAGNIEHVVTDHIGYPMATISYSCQGTSTFPRLRDIQFPALSQGCPGPGECCSLTLGLPVG